MPSKLEPQNRAFLSASFLLLFLLVASLTPAQSQAISALSKVEHIRTNSFDIYFPPSLAADGERLASFADGVLANLEDFFDATIPNRRIPVLLSDAEFDLNGYSTTYPSNRIVIYLAGAGSSGQLASFDDELHSVFVHELTHCVTMNMRSPFWSGLSVLAGDFVTPTAWVVPDAFLEGTAVWVESRYGQIADGAALRSGAAAGNGAALSGSAAAGNGAVLPDGAVAANDTAAAGGAAAQSALPGTGRLNDPAALEAVYLDVSKDGRRGLWDVSGLADYPGSGDLPYLYGGLFAEFMEERYGSGSLRSLWRSAADGNIFAGFDGTATTRGALGRYTGRQPAALWDEFLDWLAGRSLTGAGTENVAAGLKREKYRAIGAAGRRIGAFCSDGRTLYYLDRERGGVFALDLANFLHNDTENTKETDGMSGSTKPQKPVLLFPGDGYIEDMRLSADSGTLWIDWVRPGLDGRFVPARYSYDIAGGKLAFTDDREVEKPGAASSNLGAGTALPFLHSIRIDQASGFSYGLVRMGTRTMPARTAPDGSMEVLESPLLFIRSLSIGRGNSFSGDQRAGLVIALSATLPGELSKMAILEEKDEGWRLFLQKSAPEGGAFAPVFVTGANVVYKAQLGEGAQELRIADVDESTLSTAFECMSVAWKPIEAVRAALAASIPTAAARTGKNEAKAETFAKLRPVLFPRLFSTSRYPYADAESAGLTFEGADLTERLAWKASAGWDFISAVPEETLTIGLSFDENHLLFSVADRTESGAGSLLPTRILSSYIGYGFQHYLLPVNRRIWTGIAANFAGLQAAYSPGDFFSPAFSYTSAGASLEIGYSTMRPLPFSPFDREGISLSGECDYEILPGTTSAFSFSGAFSFALPRPAAVLSLYGAFAPSGGLLFHPLGRYHSVGGASYSSALSTFYPDYKEYGAIDGGSPWYCFGEAAIRLATTELWRVMGPVWMPFLPSWTIRRVSLWGGLRAAFLDLAGTPTLPSSVFLRTEVDAALLAGLAAEGHIALNIEAAWAFAPQIAGGYALHFDFGFGVTL